MTPQQWAKVCNDVADAMKIHTRPFVTPLAASTEDEVKPVGTGSYIMFEGQRLLLTCQHVRGEGGVDYRFYGSDDVFKHPGPWVEDPRPSVDVAVAAMSDAQWNATSHSGSLVPYERFAPKHQIGQQEELLFFRGFAGENAPYAFGVHQATASGYCSQEKSIEVPDPAIFEMIWEPLKIALTSGTEEAVRNTVKAEDAGGFSGSLVWNTRYLDCLNAGREWTPDQAVVTGLLRRWDTATKTLLVWRIEHLRSWLEGGAVKKLKTLQ